jgi:Fe-S-cluster containining protein
MNIDEWFSNIREKFANHMQCGKGCTACCHGLFDISMEDASKVLEGLQQLPREIQIRVREKADDINKDMRRCDPQLPHPLVLNQDDPRIDAIVDAANSPACPFLGDAGECLIYDYRPLACRLEGVPMIDIKTGPFGDWCELNFMNGIPAEARSMLALDYDALEQAGQVTFIPSVMESPELR